MSNKTYTIEKTHRGRTTQIVGTLEYLKDYFGYTLECGHSYNHKINRNPTTIKGLMTALEQSIDATQGSSYDPDYYALVD